MNNAPELVTSRWSSNRAEDRLAVVNPATGRTLWQVQGASTTEVDEAVKAARSAFDTDWRWRPAAERGQLLVACSAALRAAGEEIARLESQEMGKPVTQARVDVAVLVRSFEYFGGLASTLPSSATDLGSMFTMTVLEPYGVVGGILPFNWPPIHTGAKTAPALAVGNTVVLKPPEQAPRTVMRIGEILTTVLPKDVIQIVPGGPAVGKALASHPTIANLSFTGASSTGMAVLKSLADNLTPAVLELGGKNALVIMDDADLDLAVKAAIDGAFFNAGQACTASSRLLVQAGVHDEFVARFVKAAQKLKLGAPADPQTSIGPVANRTQQRKVLEYIEIAKSQGATVAFQGDVPSDPELADGCWVPPTVLTGVTRDTRIAREEIFGPVVGITRIRDAEEAVSVANDTPYGLVGGVISRDTAQAMAIGRRMSVGVVFINNYHRNLVGAPFGGTKHSGHGREHSPETLSEYGFTKTFRIPSGMAPIPAWTGASA